jgi:hypothetical protein
MCIARFNVHVVCCALRFARYSFQRIAFQRVVQSGALRVACSSALHFFFILQKERKAVLQRTSSAERDGCGSGGRWRRLRRETDAAAEAEEGRIILERGEETTAHRTASATNRDTKGERSEPCAMHKKERRVEGGR